MASLFPRLVGPVDENTPKIAVHAFMSFLHLRLMNRVTDNQIKNLFDLEQADMDPGGDYAVLKSKYLEVTTVERREAFHRFTWNLTLAAEWDDDGVTGLRNKANFIAELDAAIIYYNAL